MRSGSPQVSRLRLVAGPNGSGKTTFTKSLIAQHGINLGDYVNPDDEALTLLQTISDPVDRARRAQVLTRERREDNIKNGISMTYESVMSHPSHLEFVQRAAARGFRTYLYYIGVSEPFICDQRVQARVATGGHPVPRDKIYSRYHRSLGHLFTMCRQVDRAYLFDNSGSRHVLVAEVDGPKLKLFQDAIASVGGAAWLDKHLVQPWPGSSVELTRR